MQGFHEGAGMLISNFVLPNDLHVHWSMMIVLYPYITGLVDGAFIIAALYYLFDVKSFKPVARFSLLFALAFLSCATIPLLLHLGRPERNFNMLLTPNPSSAMAGFGYIYAISMGVLLLIVLFVYRPDLVRRGRDAKGLMSFFYRLLTFDSDDLSESALRLDGKIIRFLVGLGIPVAAVLHGYVGFIFGGVKANPTWSTPLMPVIFLFSACVSGIAAIVVAYIFIRKATKQSVDHNCITTCIKTLTGFFILAFCFEMLEVFSHSYLRSGYHHMVEGLLNGPLQNSFWLWQVKICSVIPLILLGVMAFVPLKEKFYTTVAALVSAILLLQVFIMRWNVVIGGQLMSKSARGYTTFHPEWFDKEGIIAVIGVMVIPFIILFILSRIFPFWNNRDEKGVI
ncbi:Polysulphide reductase NrfD [Desulfamplus magnetovallimortis]|uniref:Polysulphide reductase NrfD n=1 Tax=Desulfamplus magnetovallimortis TaxID=1246637 RepID=A0A1W1HC37_9BACT|nr:NrfD/PsrC family molybdoenzyme membrane anchor subunit [Desulfamplus magnetovallimortis]SLM30054.1 Polysulphide reductase NrfD [Desulfamplus magnetovallimortis]